MNNVVNNAPDGGNAKGRKKKTKKEA